MGQFFGYNGIIDSLGVAQLPVSRWRAAKMSNVRPAELRLPTGEVRKVDVSPFSIGRHPAKALVIPQTNVSRHHAELRWAEGRWQVMDTGSLNGVFINKVRVSEGPLEDGDELRIGVVPLIFNQVAPEFATGPNEYVAKGRAHEHAARWVDAQEAYRSAIEMDSKNVEAHLGLASVYGHGMKQWPDAITEYERALTLDPSNAEVLAGLGFAYERMGRNADALMKYTEAIRVDPQHFVARFYLGELHMHLGQWAEAAAAFTAITDAKPYYYRAHRFLGIAEFKLGRYEEALIAFRRAVQVDPLDALAYYEAARTTYKLGRAQDALSLLTRAIRIQEDLVDAYGVLGDVYVDLARNDEAMDAYRNAARLDRTNPRYCRAIGDLYGQKSQWPEAAECYAESLRLDPKDDELSRLLKRVHAKGEVAKAQGGLGPIAEKADELTHKGRDLLEQGHPEDAIPQLTEATSIAPWNPEAHAMMAVALHRTGNSTGYINAYDTAVRLDPHMEHVILDMVANEN